eukprot:EG_transcript_25615
MALGSGTMAVNADVLFGSVFQHHVTEIFHPRPLSMLHHLRSGTVGHFWGHLACIRGQKVSKTSRKKTKAAKSTSKNVKRNVRSPESKPLKCPIQWYFDFPATPCPFLGSKNRFF